ncbi:suppressor of fused domain protein [uncultured Pseudomonas sp.]|uniref:suppressor of fused domain protein n=1 Tax=uncultured Pseudomonas sp. TaxID=114707 RepID=UPI002600E65D|nr:suppressor of fused domain protein [uncultured Pseudomonas sp.]
MKFLSRLFSRTKSPAPSPAATDLANDASQDAETLQQAVRQAGHERMDRHWRSVGQLESDVLTYLISPGLSGGAQWPSTRQAYRVVRRGESLLLATDGLSDPFDGVEGMGNGFEMELFLETSDLPETMRGEAGQVDALKGSWAFELLEHVASTVADAGGITHQLAQYGVLSLELPGVSQSRSIAAQVPTRFVSADDCIGVLLGGPGPDFPTRLEDMPLSPVTLVPVVLITAAELDYVRAGGGAARAQLVARLAGAGVLGTSSLQRDSVV